MLALDKELGHLPPTPTASTPQGGWHLCFECPPDARFKNEAGPGVDIKGDGGYFVAPPSQTDKGVYRWSVHPADCPPAPLPPAWLVKITKPNVLQFVSQEMDTLTWGSGGILQASLPSLAKHVEESVRQTLPRAVGTRNACLMRYLVQLKRHPDLAAVSVDAIRPHVWKWHRRAFPKIKDREFLKSTWKETKALWPKTDPRKQAIDNVAAVAFRQDPPDFVHQRKYKPKLVKLVLLCRALQAVWGDQPFPLDCRRARDLIGVRSQTTAKKYLDQLAADGVIRCERRGRYKDRLSSEWRYLLPIDL